MANTVFTGGSPILRTVEMFGYGETDHVGDGIHGLRGAIHLSPHTSPEDLVRPHLAGQYRARGPALAIIAIPDDNPSDEDGRARPPPGEALSFALGTVFGPDDPTNGVRRRSLMARAEQFARRVGARLFGIR